MYSHMEADMSSWAALNLSTQSHNANTCELTSKRLTTNGKLDEIKSVTSETRLVHKGAHFCGALFCINCGSVTTFI